MIDEQKILDIMKDKLSEKRYRHTLGVAKSAVELAKCYGADPQKAKIAALLHDITKDEDYAAQLNYCEKFRISLTDYERASYVLLHAFTSAQYAKVKLGIEDEEIINAIKYHTTARKDMTMLEKIIYLADFIEENRTFDGVETVRAVAFDGIDNAMIIAIANTICEVVNKPAVLHRDTVDCYNQLIYERMSEKL